MEKNVQILTFRKRKGRVAMKGRGHFSKINDIKNRITTATCGYFMFIVISSVTYYQAFPQTTVGLRPPTR